MRASRGLKWENNMYKLRRSIATSKREFTPASLFWLDHVLWTLQEVNNAQLPGLESTILEPSTSGPVTFWPELLEAWLALTRVKFYRSVPVSMVLNQWLTFTCFEQPTSDWTRLDSFSSVKNHLVKCARFLKPSQSEKVPVCLRLAYILSKTITYRFIFRKKKIPFAKPKGLTLAIASGQELISNPELLQDNETANQSDSLKHKITE